MGVKISIIGAGSGAFSLNLMRDLCLTPTLADSTISLMDLNEERLNGVYTLCRRYADEVGIALNLQTTMDRRESLQAADFVINVALAAGHPQLRAGWEVAQAHGYRFGGSLRIMHDEAFWINFYQLRLFESVIEDVLTLCPNAWYLQVANPVFAAITYLGRKYPQANIVGLCHGYAGVFHLADLLKLDRAHITYEVPGVNHFVWLTRLYHEGQDAFPLLDRWIAQHAEGYREICAPGDELPKAIDLYRRFGAFPIGDTASAGGGSWGWWYHTDADTQQYWRQDPALFWSRYFARGERDVAEIRQAGADMSVRVSDRFPPEASVEQIIPMVEALARDIPRVLISNIPNHGEFVPGVPCDIAVEAPALVSKRGIQGIRTTSLPSLPRAYLLHDYVVPVNLELEAYEAGDRNRLLELIMLDPWTRSQRQARALLEDILSLPFHTAMHEHYR
jgi:alpha-galactosidase